MYQGPAFRSIRNGAAGRDSPVWSGKDAGPGAEEGVRWLEFGLNHQTLRAVCRAPRMLLLSETDYPGWKVRVDGRPEKIYRANQAFRAVPLPSGNHTVRFTYEPGSFYYGLWISLATLLGLLGALIGRGILRRYRT